MKQFVKENALVFVVIVAMVGGYLVLRTPGDKMASTAEFDALATGGTPTLIEFFSNT
jgi:hypothetical protein